MRVDSSEFNLTTYAFTVLRVGIVVNLIGLVLSLEVGGGIVLNLIWLVLSFEVGGGDSSDVDLRSFKFDLSI